MSKWALHSARVCVALLLAGIGNFAPPVSAAPLTFATAPAAPVTGMIRYVDAVNGWSIDYPAGWRVDAADPAFIQIHDPQDGALVGIHVQPTDLPLNVVVDQMLAYEEQFQRQDGLTWALSSRQQISLSDGTQAVDVVVEIMPGGRSHQLYAVKGGKAFEVNAETYVTSWDKYSADFDRMLQSFLPPA